MTKHFFEAARPQSKLKAEIVEAYFVSWARIITGAANKRPAHFDRRIAYLDLFSGPGRYRDGTPSTPLRVLQKAIDNPVFADRLVTIFNDKNPENARLLLQEIACIPGVERLRYQPQVLNTEINEAFAAQLASVRRVPTLAFLDPFGYKGLSLDLVNALISDWGSDCILFFNYVRINAALSNSYFRNHMEALFGKHRVDQLRKELSAGTPVEREATIFEGLGGALEDTGKGKRFAVSFCFKSETGKKTKHHLILVTKSFKGYNLMKSILAKRSTRGKQGVPSLAFVPGVDDGQSVLFGEVPSKGV